MWGYMLGFLNKYAINTFWDSYEPRQRKIKKFR